MKNKSFQISDIASFRIPGGMLFSPDGKRLAFFVETPDREKNTIHFSTWLMDDEETKQITYSIDAVPVMWLGSDRLLLKRETGDALPQTAQLFVISTDGGEAKPFCTLPFVLQSMKHLDGNTYIAAGVIDRGDPDAYLDSDDERMRKQKAREADKDYLVIDEMPYAADGTGIVNGKCTALFTVEFEPELKVRRITGPDTVVSEYAVSDGKVLYVCQHRDIPAKIIYTTVHCYDASAKRTKTLYGKKTHRISAPCILNGSFYVQATDMKRYGVKETPDLCRVENGRLQPVFLFSNSTGNTVNGDLRPKGCASYAVSGSDLYILVPVDDHTEILRLDADMHAENLYSESGNVSSIAACGDTVAIITQNWDTPPEIRTMHKDGTGLTKRTFLSAPVTDDRVSAPLKRVDYTSNGVDLHGWVVLPKDYNPKKKYPAILDMHGGPRVTYGEVFSFEKQLFSDRGYFVFYTNVPGSDARGDEFADIRGKFGTVDYDAFMAFTDAVLAAFPAIDSSKLCVMGLSYGGYMSSRIITKTDRFCCASVQAPVANWITMDFLSDIGSWFSPDQTAAEGPFDWKNLWETSPLKYAENVKTPALVLQGVQDYRCPVWEGMQFMQALAVRNVETRMVLFRNGSHNMHYTGLPGDKIRRLQEILSWFDKHTGKEK